MSVDETPEASSILELTPNGLLVVDQDARIHFVNPAFRKMFGTGDEDLSGRKASQILHTDFFERAIATGKEFSARGVVPERDFYYRAAIFRTGEGTGQYCGVFIDTTDEERARAELVELKRETLARAEEVIHRQMHAAQEIAGLLGETTAETKVILTKLSDLFRREDTG